MLIDLIIGVICKILATLFTIVNFQIACNNYLFLSLQTMGASDTTVSAKFIGPSNRQDKYVIGPICLISSQTKMSKFASNTMYTMYTQVRQI